MLGKDITRKKLNKLIGKEVEYEGVVLKHENTRTLVLDVKHKGKMVTDHVWLNKTYSLQILDSKTPIRFRATASTYTDKKGIRKLGLNKAYRVKVINGEIDKVKEDNRQKYLRGLK